MTQVKVRFDTGKVSLFPKKTKALAALSEIGDLKAPLVAVLVNNELKDLDTELSYDCDLSPVLSNSSAGASVYRRSLCFILAIASRQLMPQRRLIAGMAIGAGFYHYYHDEIPLDEAQVEALSDRMAAIVAGDSPIRIEPWPWETARNYFKESGQLDTLELIENLNNPTIPLNECAGFRDLHVSPLVASTGILSTWELLPYHGGLLLRYPHKDSPLALDPFEDVPLLYRISEEYRERGRVLGVGSVGVLNRLGSTGRVKEYIQVAEALQNKKVAELADQIGGSKGKVKVVLIAGPSSSGKTTTSKKLAIQLKVLGYEPIPIELDNFFVDRTKTPLDTEGKPDFECLGALDEQKKSRHTFEEAVDIVCDALAPLGGEYVSTLRTGLLGGWVDRYENKGKRSGAFSAGSYEGDPYILLNYKDDVLRDLFTLAHEGGHSMHSWLSARSNPFLSYSYTIFEAEVASTFNEHLVFDYLYERSDSDEEKAALLSNRIDDSIGTLFRQTMFAEFEAKTHAMAESGEALTVDSLREEFGALQRKYFGPAMVFEPCSDLEGLRIPHFYNAFYVYKYATGISASKALAARVLGGGKAEREAYFAFLKSGGGAVPYRVAQVGRRGYDKA